MLHNVLEIDSFEFDLLELFTDLSLLFFLIKKVTKKIKCSA